MSGEFATIVRHEWRLARRRGPARVLAVAWTALLISAGAAGIARAATDWSAAAWTSARDAAARAAVVAAADGPAERDPRWGVRHPDFVANDLGTSAVLPPAPLVALATGHADLHPAYLAIRGTGSDAATSGGRIEHPQALLTGAFDLLFVLVHLLPIALVALTFDLTAAERERGTLALLLAQAVDPRRLVTAKLAVAAAIVVAPAVVVSLIAAVAAPGPLNAGRLALWTVALLFYAAFWGAAALAVDAGSRASAASAVVLGALWLGVVVLVPAALNALAPVVDRPPSGVAFADAARRATREALTDGSRVLGHFLEDHPTASAVGRDGLRQYALLKAARDAEVQRRLQPVLDDYRAAVEAQRQRAWWLQFLSPALATHALLTDAAGTSGDRHRRLVVQAEAFRLAWRDHFAPLLVEPVALTADVARAMPAFVPREEPAAAVAGRAIVPTAGIAALTAGLSWLGLARLARLTPRD